MATSDLVELLQQLHLIKDTTTPQISVEEVEKLQKECLGEGRDEGIEATVKVLKEIVVITQEESSQNRKQAHKYKEDFMRTLSEKKDLIHQVADHLLGQQSTSGMKQRKRASPEQAAPLKRWLFTHRVTS